MEKETVVAVSGHFDPLHVGHLNLFEAAKKLGTRLVVIVNNDESTMNKKNYVFMPCEERMRIVESLKVVDGVIRSITESTTIEETLLELKPDVFVHGGKHIPLVEQQACEFLGCEVVLEGGGEKVNSSSTLAQRGLQQSFPSDRLDG